jgi:hypothetical protein
MAYLLLGGIVVLAVVLALGRMRGDPPDDDDDDGPGGPRRARVRVRATSPNRRTPR